MRNKTPHLAERQSRKVSALEAVTNVAVGFTFAFIIQIAIFPIFGISVSAADNVLIAIIFTAVSLIRSFALRRLFEAVRVHRLTSGGGLHQ